MESFQLGMIWGSLMMGLLCGILPFVLAIAYAKNTKNSVVALVLCVLSGFLGGAILAIPVSLISTIVIVIIHQKSTQEDSAEN
jgi:hypothetical protein